MADQNKDGVNPIASGLQPGPGEHLQSSETTGASMSAGSSGSTAGLTPTNAGIGGSTDSPSSTTTSDKGFSKQAIKESGTRIANEAKQYAGDVASRAKEKSRTIFQEQKESAVGQVDTVANAIRSTASQLEGQGQGQVARYVGMVADQLESFSGRLRDKDLDSLINDTQNLARRAPGTFLVGSVVAGFLLARFLKSSSEQRQDRLAISTSRPRFSSTEDRESSATMPRGAQSTGAQSVGADGTPGGTSEAPYGTTGAGAATTPLNGSRSGGGAL